MNVFDVWNLIGRRPTNHKELELSRRTGRFFLADMDFTNRWSCMQYLAKQTDVTDLYWHCVTTNDSDEAVKRHPLMRATKKPCWHPCCHLRGNQKNQQKEKFRQGKKNTKREKSFSFYNDPLTSTLSRAREKVNLLSHQCIYILLSTKKLHDGHNWFKWKFYNFDWWPLKKL